MAAERNRIAEVVAADKMPACPFCDQRIPPHDGKPESLVCFFLAHGFVGLAHQRCVDRALSEDGAR